MILHNQAGLVPRQDDDEDLPEAKGGGVRLWDSHLWGETAE